MGLAAPEFLDGLDVFQADFAAALEAFGREDKVVRVPARGDGDADPALGKVVHDGPFLGDAHGMVERKDHAAAAERDALRVAREGSGEE